MELDAIVVGGGVVGCAVARELAPDRDVLVVEAGQLAAAATALAAGEITITPSYSDVPAIADHANDFFRSFDGTGEFSFTERESIELDEKGNHPDTVKEKLRKLEEIYGYWQADPAFPHPTDYNPIELAEEKTSFTAPATKEPPRIPVSDLRTQLEAVTNIRDRAIIATQLKLGLRATELCNLQLSDVDIQNRELKRHYPEMGTHPMLKGRENAIYIPPSNTASLPVEGRPGNKSQRPRVLPLDDEMRRVLIQYLLIRPDSAVPWLFLSKRGNGQLRQKIVTTVWKDAFHPKYGETDQHDSVTSHYGRHRFTTFWRVERDLNRELIRYMRGDTAGSKSIEERGAIDDYIHTYYEDIEELYRGNIYKLGI